MKNFLRRTLLFLLPIFGYIVFATFFLEHLLEMKNGPSTKEQIKISFDNALKNKYDVLVLGNSRIYRGINPDQFEIGTYNFAHDDDSYNQLYYKIKFLESNKKTFKHLVLGIDYFQFNSRPSTRNYAYADYLGKDYLKDYSENVFELKLNYFLENIDIKKLKYLRGSKGVSYIKSNGQYIKPGVAKESDTITRDITRTSMKVRYFKKILKFCNERKIPVYLVMLPIRPNEMKSYTKAQLDSFNKFKDKFVDNKNVYFYDFSMDNRFKLKDYTDITHLNSLAADRFSKILFDTLSVNHLK